jgi:peptidyl-prolyl cis-trans isomerase SurA
MKQILSVIAGAISLAALGAGLLGAPPAAAQDATIAAVVNGQIITSGDVDSRARLLAVSTGMPADPAILNRLKPQITRELIDQTLQLQEINRRNIVVPETDIANAVAHIEQSNNMPAGALRGRLQASGVNFLTLIAQLRTEIGWQNVLHKVLGPSLQPTPGDINAEKKALQAQIGSTQYHLAEIFIPVTDPADDQTAENFATAVIQQLRQGAPFPIIAAQFSQADSALQGGDLGFVPLSQLDPGVAAVVQVMPVGAISNPVRVPGGYDIVQMQGVQKVGTNTETKLSIRQAFVPYPTPITNGNVGPAQAAVITKVVQAGHAVHSCADMEALNTNFGASRPADPGPVNLGDVTPPAFQALLANLPIGQVSQPLIAADGVSLVIVCTRQTNTEALPSDDAIGQVIIEHRVQMESQQLLDDLRHRSIITTY